MLYCQGFQSEVSGILGHITRWDVCRYLKKTFSYALNRVQPDVVIMLGKLTPEPLRYALRVDFHMTSVYMNILFIYFLNNFQIQVIYLTRVLLLQMNNFFSIK